MVGFEALAFGSLIHSNKRKSLSKMAVKCVYLIKDHINAFRQFPHTKCSSEENDDCRIAADDSPHCFPQLERNGGKMAICGFLVKPMNRIENDCVNMGASSGCALKFHLYLPQRTIAAAVAVAFYWARNRFSFNRPKPQFYTHVRRHARTYP